MKAVKNLLKKLFVKKQKPVEGIYNIHHPDIAPLIEVAFECEGVTYYRMKNEFSHRVGRYKFINAYGAEAELRMSLKLLKAYLKELKKQVQRNDEEKIYRLIFAIESHTNLAFEPETIKRLASVMYFDETEDLRDFDEEHGKKKIEVWDKAGTYDFFLTQPMSEFLNLKGISAESLKKFITEATETMRTTSQTFEQLKASEESS